MRPIKSFGERIADALVEDGLLSNRQVDELLELQKKEGTRLLKLILEKSYVGEVDMVVSMGRVLNVLQPLINAERSRYQVDAARARTEQALLQYQNAVTNAFREVSDALEARREFAEQLREQERQVQALRDASARVLRRYEVGYSSYFEVIDADSSLFTAELQMVQAYRNNLVAVVQFYKALGGGWQAASHGRCSLMACLRPNPPNRVNCLYCGFALNAAAAIEQYQDQAVKRAKTDTAAYIVVASRRKCP